MSNPHLRPCDYEYIDVVFDGPPGAEAGRFVEVEDPSGRSINAGEWIDRGNGLWALRITTTPLAGTATSTEGQAK